MKAWELGEAASAEHTAINVSAFNGGNPTLLITVFSLQLHSGTQATLRHTPLAYPFPGAQFPPFLGHSEKAGKGKRKFRLPPNT